MARFKTLSEDLIEKDPFIQFDNWYRKRQASVTCYPDAFSLATSSPEGRASVRTVLLKEYSSDGFVFFTNYLSRKGKELSENPFAAMLFYWPEDGRQIRIEGRVEKASAEESDNYFFLRPRESRIGAWASKQSTVIPGKKFIKEQVSYFSKKYKGREIPRPDYWGGFRIVPEVFEFWQEGKHRLHDRIIYSSSGVGWKIERLSP